MAQLPTTQNIEPFYPRLRTMDLARETLGVSAQTNAPNYLDLTGNNVTVAVVDTGVDANHPDLFPRVAQLPNPPVLATDTDGHGTFMAGVIASSGQNPVVYTNAPGSSPGADYRGLAPSANIFPLPIDLIFPLQPPFVFSDAEIQTFIGSSNISIANMSWGYGSFQYDSAAASYDAAVRDSNPYRTNSKANPVIYVFAAGNEGFGNDAGTGAINDTILSPAVAKNVITVGALEQIRNITLTFVITNIVDVGLPTQDTNYIIYDALPNSNSRDEVASFSSRGQVGVGVEGSYGRFKPDLVAPGFFVVSTATTTPPGWGTDPLTNSNPLLALLDTNLYGNSGQPMLYRWENGTSISAAMVSGMLALMQEFFEQRLGMTNSPAMMKALLINGARPVGNRAYDLSPTNTVNDQGWGLPQLTNSIPAVLAGGPGNTNEWPIIMLDQNPTNVLATGESISYQVTLKDPLPGQFGATNFPLRFTLVWTDPPGNPSVGIKIVNDLDIVVFDPVTTNYYFGNNIAQGSEFTKPMAPVEVFGTNVPMTGTDIGPLPYYVPYLISNTVPTNLPIDFVNNTENVFIDGPVSTNFIVTVFARRVNVNAVSENTNKIGQDFALVISSGNPGLSNIFTFMQVTNEFTNRVSKVLENGKALQRERVGANFPLTNPTNGLGNQWNFYVFTNQTAPESITTNFTQDPETGDITESYTTNTTLVTGTNIAFIIYRPVNLGKPRVKEADIDLFVSVDANLNVTNLLYNKPLFSDTIFNTNTTVRSFGRGGSELVLLTNGITPVITAISTNASDPTGQSVFYVAVKAEDQQAADYSLIVVSTDSFAETNGGGVLVKAFPLPQDIPDGSPESPQGIEMFAINPYQMLVDRVVVTNLIVSHEDLGDLVGVLNHLDTDVYLFNHSLNNGVNNVSSLNLTYDDRRPQFRPDGPGTLSQFIGTEGSGLWLLTIYDNSPEFTGRLENFEVQLYKQTNNMSGANVSLEGGEAYIGLIFVPPFATNMVMDVSYNSGSGPLSLYMRLNGFPPPFSTNYDSFFQFLPPASAYTNDIYGSYAGSAPLASGFYFFTLINEDLVSPVSFNFNITFGLSLGVADKRTLSPNVGNIPITDNAATNSQIVVNEDRVLTDVSVGVNIEHPWISDLVLRLTSPRGTRVLLYENRGVLSEGLSVTNLNVNFSEDTNLVSAGFGSLVPIKFAPVPYTNFSSPPELTTVKFFGGPGAQGGTGVDFFGQGLFISGTTVTNAQDGLAARFDLPIAPTNNAVWQTNWPGPLTRGVIYFDELTDTVQISGASSLSNAVTIEAVVFIPSPPPVVSDFQPDGNYAGGVIFNENGAAPGDPLKDILLAGGPLGLQGDVTPPAQANGPLVTNTPLTLDTWHHVAFVYDGTNRSLYLDGSLVALDPVPVPNTPITTNNNAFGYLGAMLRNSAATFSSSFIGYMDSFRISSIARYSGTGFTPPGGDMIADANTALLYNFNQPSTDAVVFDSGPENRFGFMGINPDIVTLGGIPTRPVFTNISQVVFGQTARDSFNGVAVTDEGVYYAGDTLSLGTNAAGVFTNKAVIVKYPFGGVNGVQGPGLQGTIFYAQLPVTNSPGVVTFDFTNSFNAITSQKEPLLAPANNFIYATGTGQTLDGGDGNVFLAKMDTQGNYVWINWGASDVAAPATTTNYSSGNAIAASGGLIWVAGVTNIQAGLQLVGFPMLTAYDPNGAVVFNTTSPTFGAYYGIAVSGNEIYTVGSQLNGLRKLDWLLEKWVINGNTATLTWSQVVDGVVGPTAPGATGASGDDELFAVVISGTRVYATGYMIDESSANNRDIVMLEIDGATGNIVSTSKFGGTSNDTGRAITTDGVDLYVVGEAGGAVPVPRTASGSSAPDVFVYDTGATSGILTITYDFFTVPDSLKVYYEGTNIFDSGLVSDTGTFTIPYAGASTVVTIVMNEAGGQIGTAWNYTISSAGAFVLDQEAVILRYRLKNAYLPEEPLSVLRGESSLGTWTLEVADTRIGPDFQPVPVQQLVNWELNLTYAPTNLSTLVLVPGQPFRFPLSGGTSRYFAVDAPAAAAIATNSIMAGRNVEVRFNANRVPEPGAPGNFILSPGTLNGKYILTANSTPKFMPGKKYYLAVQNSVPTGPDNVVEILLNFDNTVSVTQLTSTVPVKSQVNFPGDFNYYKFTVGANATAAALDLYALNGNADLYVRKGSLPDAQHFDYRSVNASTRDDRIYLVPGVGQVPLSAGTWYLGVRNAQNASAGYLVRYTQITGAAYTVNTIAGGQALAGVATPGNAPRVMYKHVVPSGTNAVLFELVNVTGGDANLVLSRTAYPNPSAYALGSFNAGILPEQIALKTNLLAASPNIDGTWYLGVYNSSAIDASYVLRAGYATNGVLVGVTPITISPLPIFRPDQHSIEFNWNTLVGERYQVEFSTDLKTWTVIKVITAPPGGLNFIDTGVINSAKGFYRIRQVP